MTRRDWLKTAELTLQAAGVPDPEVDARLLLSHVTGIEPLLLLAGSGSDDLTDAEQIELFSLLQRRKSREPLQYIIGEAWFMGRAFSVCPDVLIPRQDTECLCEEVLFLIKNGDMVLDIGTGSGVLAITIAAERPRASVTAVDISDEALALSALNAKAHGVHVRFLKSDFYDGVKDSVFDVIVSNPPYIPTGSLGTLQEEVRREPALALDGGNDGLNAYREIRKGLDAHLKPGGVLALELGDDEISAVQALFDGDFESVRVVKDLACMERALILRGYRRQNAGKA